MSDIFKASGSILDVNSCTIVIGVVQIVGVYTSTIFVDIIGRRILMLISTLGIGLGCISFGFFTYYAQIYDLSDLNWIPLVLMILIIYLANIGLIGLFFVVLVELFPAKVRQFTWSRSFISTEVLKLDFTDTFFGYIYFGGFFEPLGLLYSEVISPFASLFRNFGDHVVFSCFQSSHFCILPNLFARN